MFTVYCPGHRARVLLGPRSIDALIDTPAGIELRWTCRCGTHGALRPARHQARPRVVDVA